MLSVYHEISTDGFIYLSHMIANHAVMCSMIISNSSIYTYCFSLLVKILDHVNSKWKSNDIRCSSLSG